MALAFSQAAENNKQPVADVLRGAFKDVGTVLEIASGTGQHAVYFGATFPHLTWQPSDLPEHIGDIQDRLAQEGPENALPPVALDVAESPWQVSAVDAIFSANAVHIMSWGHVEQMFAGMADVLALGGILCLYGPFKYGGDFTTPSNAGFDGWLKSRDPVSGIRDFEAVDALARGIGLGLVGDTAMPANNQLLMWKRSNAR